MIKTKEAADKVRFGYRNPDGSKTVWEISGSKTYVVKGDELIETPMPKEVEDFALKFFSFKLTVVKPSKSKTK